MNYFLFKLNFLTKFLFFFCCNLKFHTWLHHDDYQFLSVVS